MLPQGFSNRYFLGSPSAPSSTGDVMTKFPPRSQRRTPLSFLSGYTADGIGVFAVFGIGQRALVVLRDHGRAHPISRVAPRRVGRTIRDVGVARDRMDLDDSRIARFEVRERTINKHVFHWNSSILPRASDTL